MANPPLDAPREINFVRVTPGVAASADGGNLLKFDGSVVARIDGDSSVVFSISGLGTEALRRDPELPLASLANDTDRGRRGAYRYARRAGSNRHCKLLMPTDYQAGNVQRHRVANGGRH